MKISGNRMKFALGALMTAALSTEGGKAALAGPLAKSRQTISTVASAVVATDPPCKAEWESSAKAAGG